MPESTNRIDTALSASRAAGRPGLWPFIPAGFPDLDSTALVIRELARRGVAGIEVGFPFSDPIADGPTIQSAFARALQRGVRVADLFRTIADVRRDVTIPLLAMVSASIVYRLGSETFVASAAEAGLDGVIVPDLSLEEAPALAGVTRAAGLRLVMLVAPTTSAARQARIAAAASGFLYYMSVAGVTGERAAVAGDLREHVAALRRASNLPVLVGFGISTSQQVRDVCAVADGAIVGSAIVRRMLDAVDGGLTGPALATAVGDYAASLLP